MKILESSFAVVALSVGAILAGCASDTAEREDGAETEGGPVAEDALAEEDPGDEREGHVEDAEPESQESDTDTPSKAVADSTAESTRTIPAYKDSNDPDRTIKVFTVSFPARAGEKRYITSKILATQASSTPDPLLMASVSIACFPSNSRSSAGATQNTLRGTTTTLTPRFVYTASKAGTVKCTLSAAGGRPRPASGPSSANVWTVATGSFLSASAPIADWSAHFISGAKSRVLNPGEAWTPISESVTIGQGVSSFYFISDHKVTTCSSVGGSRDETTGNVELCAGRTSPVGTRVNLKVKARQRNVAGDGWCNDGKVVTTLTTTVSKNVHHKMLFSKGLVKVNPSCGRSFSLTGTITAESGADLMVHAPSETALVIPD